MDISLSNTHTSLPLMDDSDLTESSIFDPSLSPHCPSPSPTSPLDFPERLAWPHRHLHPKLPGVSRPGQAGVAHRPWEDRLPLSPRWPPDHCCQALLGPGFAGRPKTFKPVLLYHRPQDFALRHLPSDDFALRHLPSDDFALSHMPPDDFALRHIPSDDFALRHLPSDDYALRHPALAGLGSYCAHGGGGGGGFSLCGAADSSACCDACSRDMEENVRTLFHSAMHADHLLYGAPLGVCDMMHGDCVECSCSLGLPPALGPRRGAVYGLRAASSSPTCALRRSVTPLGTSDRHCHGACSWADDPFPGTFLSPPCPTAMTHQVPFTPSHPTPLSSTSHPVTPTAPARASYPMTSAGRLSLAAQQHRPVFPVLSRHTADPQHQTPLSSKHTTVPQKHRPLSSRQPSALSSEPDHAIRRALLSNHPVLTDSRVHLRTATSSHRQDAHSAGGLSSHRGVQGGSSHRPTLTAKVLDRWGQGSKASTSSVYAPSAGQLPCSAQPSTMPVLSPAVVTPRLPGSALPVPRKAPHLPGPALFAPAKIPRPSSYNALCMPSKTPHLAESALPMPPETPGSDLLSPAKTAHPSGSAVLAPDKTVQCGTAGGPEGWQEWAGRYGSFLQLLNAQDSPVPSPGPATSSQLTASDRRPLLTPSLSSFPLELSTLVAEQTTAFPQVLHTDPLQGSVEEADSRRHKCPYCQVTCTNNGQLKGHLRVHTGERPYRCECGRAFARNEELTRHRRIHSGLRPHQCCTCGKRFGRKDHLNKHQKTHLGTSEKKVHACQVPGCQQRYTRSDALARHQWGAHGIRARSTRIRPAPAVPAAL